MSEVRNNNSHSRPENDGHQPTHLTRNGRPQPRPIRAIPDIPGFPTRDAPIPAHASCKDICERFPNSIRDAILDDFLHHNWSAQQIFAALAPKAKAWMTCTQVAGMNSKNPANAIAKRLGKRRDKHIKAGTLDKLKKSNDIRPSGASFQGTARPKYARRVTVDAADETALAINVPPIFHTSPKTPHAPTGRIQQFTPATFEGPQLDGTPSTACMIRLNALEDPYGDAWIFEQPPSLLAVDSDIQYQTYEPAQPVKDAQYSYSLPYMGSAGLNENQIDDFVEHYGSTPVYNAGNLFGQHQGYGLNDYYVADQQYPNTGIEGQQADYDFRDFVDDQSYPHDNYPASNIRNVKKEITVDDVKKYPDVLYDTDEEDENAKPGY
jgi:hypothetical protein